MKLKKANIIKRFKKWKQYIAAILRSIPLPPLKIICTNKIMNNT